MSSGIVTGSNNIVQDDCTNINLIGCDDCIVESLTENLIAIRCSSITFTPEDSNKTYVDNGLVVGNRSRLASASAPTFVNGDYNLYYVDTSGGNANIYINHEKLIDTPITFKVIDATNSIVFNSLDNSGLFEFNTLPYTYVPNLGDSLTTVSDGTDIFII